MTGYAKGAASAVTAYIWWAFLPFYWKMLGALSAYEIVCHRVVWSVVFLLVIFLVSGKYDKLKAVNGRELFLLFCSGLLIYANWFIGVWGTNNGQVLELGLGQFITPLVSMFFGRIFFGDRMNARQYTAVFLAVFALIVQVYLIGSVSPVALSLTITFAVYGLIKKFVKAEAVTGMFYETLLTSPIALVFLVYLNKTGTASYPYDMMTNFLLCCTGAATTIPLILFSSGVKSIDLTTLGFIQYLGPTSFFILGAFVFHEPLSVYKMITFGLIWVAVAIYLTDAVMKKRKIKN